MKELTRYEVKLHLVCKLFIPMSIVKTSSFSLYFCANSIGFLAQLININCMNFTVMDSCLCLGQYGFLPLHWAAQGGHTETVRRLLEVWAEKDSRDRVSA